MSEECVTQDKLLVADIILDCQSPKPCTVPTRRKVWKLRDPTARLWDFCEWEQNSSQTKNQWYLK